MSPHFISCRPQVSAPARPSPWRPGRTGSSKNWSHAQFLCIEIWPKSFSLIFSAHISPSHQPQAQCASTLIIHSLFAQAHSKSCWFQPSLSTLAPHRPLLSSHSPFSLLPHLLYWPLKKNKPLTESTLYHQQMFMFYVRGLGNKRQTDMVSDLKELLEQEQGGQHS